jgi:protein TonB
LTSLVLVSMMGQAPLPEPTAGKTLLVAPPLVPQAPRVAPPPVLSRGGPARRRDSSVATRVAEIVPAVPQVDPLPIGPAVEDVPPCLSCPVGEPRAGNAGEGPPGDGSSPDREGPGAGGGGPLRVGSGVQAPRKIEHVAPRYPELARRVWLQGIVELECVIDPAGVVSEIRVLSGPALLREAAVEAVRKWRYTPTKLNGAPVPIVMTVTVRFRLRREA